MTQERDHAHATSTTTASPDYDEDAPGRASRSALLRKPDHAVASGLVQRKARDANGVAEGADSAVAAASSSSGSPLPEPLMRKFESSLGADLSGVRVHTGAESATANDAVGAKAYTMGNDIHFGSGQYNPSSPGGEHLLAHEVAHTVQQGGGAQRMQFKLAVSSPGDALEHEADRAADAMVSGVPATVTGVGGVARSALYRDTKGLNPLLDPPKTWKPDPTDPFEQAPTNWGAFPPAAGYAVDVAPLTFKDVTFVGPEPKPYISESGEKFNGAGWDGKGKFVTGQLEKADRCNAAFRSSYTELTAGYKAASGHITKYFDAANELESGDLHRLLGWDKVKGAKDLGALAAGQDGKTGVSVADLSKAKIDTTHDKKMDNALEKSRRLVTLADEKAMSAARKYVAQVEVSLNAATAVGLAYRKIGLKKLKDNEASLSAEKASLELQKAEAAKGIETTVKHCQMSAKLAFSIAKGDGGLSIGGAVADAAIYVTGELLKGVDPDRLEEQIASIDSKIQAARVVINEEEFQLLDGDHENRKSEFKTARKLLPTLKHDMVLAIADAQTAYDEFASVAAASAGGGSENKKRVEAAIKAIPKVQLLVGRIAEITQSISLPSYSADSGVGYNAVSEIANESFTPPYCLLKGYKVKFAAELTTWNNRLTSLKAVADAFAK